MSITINDEALELLRSVPYFKTLGRQALEDVAQEVSTRQYAAGQIIFLEDEPDAGLYLVVIGLCKVFRMSAEGREHVLAILKAGHSCNEVPVVDGGPNPANFAAIEDSTVWIISAEGLNRLRRRHPQLNDIIIKNLALRCRQLVQRVYNLSFLSVTGRLAAFLLQQNDDRSALSRRRWTQDEIATHLGTVREMVGRALRELHDAGVIAIDRHRIEVLDREALEEFIRAGTKNRCLASTGVERKRSADRWPTDLILLGRRAQTFGSVWITGENLSLARLIKSDHVERLGRYALDFHTRRTCRHTRHSQTRNVGPLCQKAFNFRGGHVPFNNIAIDDGGMARLEFGWNIILAFNRDKIFDILSLNSITFLFHVVHPVATTASGR